MKHGNMVSTQIEFVAWENKGADQTAHPHSLISAFVIRYLSTILANLAQYSIWAL